MDAGIDYQELVFQLEHWDGRRRLADALIWLPRALLVGLLAGVAFAALARYRPLLDNQEMAFLSGGLILLSLLLGIAVLLIQRRSPVQQARFADRRFDLLERASTAVEIHSGLVQTEAALAQLQLADTLRTIRAVDARRTLPLRFNLQDLVVILLALTLLLAAIILPNPQTEVLERQRAIDASIAQQIQALESLVAEIEQDPALAEEQKAELMAPLESALEELQAGDLSQEEAVAVLSEAEAELRDLSRNDSAEALSQVLQDAAQPLVDNLNSNALGEALSDGSLAEASSAANDLADRMGELSAGELATLAQDLAEAASALGQVDPELASDLSRAAEAMRQGDTAEAREALREAAGTLQARAQEQATAQRAAEAAGQLNQSREAVAQAGQQGQQGQAGQQGQGQGQQGSGQQGQGQGQQGQGDGQGEAQGQGLSVDQGDGTGGPGPGGGHAENVYVPEFVDLSGQEGVDVELPAECIANPEACGALLGEQPSELGGEDSLVPYDQVFGDYRNAAYEALEDEYVPLGLRSTIRDYFSSLEP